MKRKLSVMSGLLACLWLTACAEAVPDPKAAVLAEATAAMAERQTTSDTMSYEVSIAIAAANRKRALRDCEERASDERPRCRSEVESDWDIAKAALADLRGDQG